MKHFLLLTLLIGAASSGFSQKIKYGMAAGMNLNRLKIDHPDAKPTDYRLGFQINGLLKYHLSEKIALRAEPGYIAKRSQSNAPVSEGYPRQKFRLNYFSLPLLMDYSPVEKLSLLLGPEIALRLSAKMVFQGDKEDIRDTFDRKFDLGIRGGASLELVPNLELSVRYFHSFVSMDKKITFVDEFVGELQEDDGYLFNNGFLFSLGIWFN